MVIDMLNSFMLVILGIAMIVIWVSDISNNPEIDMSNGFFRAREKVSNNIFWFHIVVELITAVLLIASGIIILQYIERLMFVAYFALGSLFYSSVNSLGWAFANKSRRSYAWPMLGGIIVSVLSVINLVICH